MKKVLGVMVGGFVAASFLASSASALPQFKKAFQQKYVDGSSNDAFKAAFKNAGCNVCHVHVEGKEDDRKLRNDYGQALAKITGGTAKDDLAAAKKSGGPAAAKAKMDELLKTLDGAFDKVESEKSPAGPTYGELIKSGKLPVSQ